MEIRAKCKYDLDSVKALNNLVLFKKADPKKRMITWTIVYAAILAIVVLEMIVFGKDLVLFILMGVLIAWLGIMYFLYFITPKIQYKSMSKMKNVENEYIFYEDKLKAITKSEEYNGEAEIEYSFFVRAFETTKYLFLYQTNNQVFIVDKSTVEGGTVGEIRSRLCTALNDKFIMCKY